MTGFRADVAALGELVDRLDAFARAATTSAEDLDAQVTRLHGQWSGPAAAAHLAAHREWRTAAGRMQAAVGELRRSLEVARENYTAAAHVNARMWG